MAENSRSKAGQRSLDWLFRLVVIVGIIGISYATHEVAALKQFDASLQQVGRPLVPVAVVMAVLGLALFVGCFLAPFFAAGGAKEPAPEDLEKLGTVRPMSHAEVEDLSARTLIGMRPGWSRARITGETAGAAMTDAFNFRDMKEALRTGEMWRDPRWKRRLTMFAGFLLLFYGGFGAFALRGPLYATVLCGGTLLYVTARLGWAFARA